jgi:hypothetical protein
VLTVVGVILPWVDVIQTLPAIEYRIEGNPFINLAPPEYQLHLLVISHVGFSIIALVLGWLGKSPRNVEARFGLSFFLVVLTLIAVNNIIAFTLHGLS